MQTRRGSALEAIANVVAGFFLGIVVQHAFFPQAPLSEDVKVVLAFTVLSFARSYVIRRLFNLAPSPPSKSIFSAYARSFNGRFGRN